MLAAFNESPQHVVDPPLAPFARPFEPGQHVRVEADMDILLVGGHAKCRLHPVRRMRVIAISCDRAFRLLLGRRVYLRLVRVALAGAAHSANASA